MEKSTGLKSGGDDSEQLNKLHDGLSRPRTRTRLDLVWERIGSLKAHSGGIVQHYDITVVPDDQECNAVEGKRTFNPTANRMVTRPRVWCLRTKILDADAEHLWCTYIVLTELEAVLRSLRS